MQTATAPDRERLLATLHRLLEIPAADLKTALTHAANAVADALRADKVDAFLYDETRDSLVALGTSTQPLSNLQKKLGLDVLPLSNGGRVVYVYKTGKTLRTGNLLDDAEELRGVKEGLRIGSKIGVPLDVDGQRRGMMMIASLEPSCPWCAKPPGYWRCPSTRASSKSPLRSSSQAILAGSASA